MGQARPFYPEWAARYRGVSHRICHIFDNDFDGLSLPAGSDAIVVGSGITGAQVAHSLVTAGRNVLLLTRRELAGGQGKTSSTDWRDGRLRSQLCACPTLRERDAMLQAEGDRGTIPPWDLERIQTHIESGALTHRLARIAHAIPQNGDVTLITEDGLEYRRGILVLATGFYPHMQDWLRSAAKQLQLPSWEDGEPNLTVDFEWGTGSGIFLTGKQALRVGGPFAQNIVGGQQVADVICGLCS
jgi:hypothetical protein